MSRTIDQLVSQQIERWEAQTASVERETRQVVRQRPTVTLSRSLGSGGKQIARLVADRLQLSLVDKDLVERIAEQADVRSRVVNTLDGRVVDQLTNWLTDQFDTGAFTTSDYLRYLSRVVLAVGQHGKTLIVGRGAQFILNQAFTLRVRITAPLEWRINRQAEERGVDRKLARSEILRTDAEREAFIRWHFNSSIDDPIHYDVILNTAVLPISVCADLVVGAFTGRFSPGA